MPLWKTRIDERDFGSHARGKAYGNRKARTHWMTSRPVGTFRQTVARHFSNRFAAGRFARAGFD